jgi:hypothetical protein
MQTNRKAAYILAMAMAAGAIAAAATAAAPTGFSTKNSHVSVRAVSSGSATSSIDSPDSTYHDL